MDWRPISEAPRDRAVLGGWYRPHGGPWVWERCVWDDEAGDGCWTGIRGGSPTHYLMLPDPPDRGATVNQEPPRVPTDHDAVNWDGEVVNPPVAVD